MKTFVWIFVASASSMSARAGELMLFVNPSIRKIVWDSPGTALRSSGWSQIHNLISHENPATVTAAVGHVVVRFECSDTLGRKHDVWTGMTGQNDFAETKTDLLKDQIGIGVLFKAYKDGAVDPSEKSRNQVANYYGRLSPESRLVFGRRRIEPKFLRVPVDSRACDRLVDFHETFKKLSYDKKKLSLEEQRKKPDHEVLSFGFTIDPYEAYLAHSGGEENTALGGGCSSFALAFLKLSGHYDPFFEKKFVRQIDVSERLIGGSYGRIKGNKVDVFEIAAGNLGASWKGNGEPTRSLRFYDVEKIWNFIGETQVCLENPSSTDCRPDTRAWIRSRSELRQNDYSFAATRTYIRRTPLPSARGGAPVTFKKEEITHKIRTTREGIDFGIESGS